MAEHKLAILVQAVGTAKAAKSLKGIDQTISNIGAHAGRGIRTAASNIARLGVVAAGAGVAVGAMAIKSGLESLAERENVISATNAAIKATGNAAKVSAADIRNWSEALESATGAAVDDKEIQAGANALLRFKAVSGNTFKRALTAAVDLGAALKTGPEQAAKMLGKALVDPLKGMMMLKRAGVVLNEQEQKRIKAFYKLTDAQQDQLKGMTKAEAERYKLGLKQKADLKAQEYLLRKVEQRYKGAAEASAGPYTRALNMMADASEDAKMALAEGFLPVIERAANWLRTKLADPNTIASLRSFGNQLASAFDEALAFAERVPWGSIADGLRTGADWAGKLFDAFRSLPPEVQGTIVALAGLNKLSGGAIGGIVSELGRGLIKGVLGINAAVVNVNGATVNGGGGLPTAGTAAATAGGAGAVTVALSAASITAIGTAGTMALTQGIPSLFKALGITKDGGGAESSGMTGKLGPSNGLTTPIFERMIGAQTQNFGESIGATTKAVGTVERKQVETLGVTRDMGARTQAGLANTARSAAVAGMVAASATGMSASRIVSAIYSARPVVNTYVTVNRDGSVSTRQGKGSGSAGGGNDDPVVGPN